MVRFIIEAREKIYNSFKEFTFHYGQIYYKKSRQEHISFYVIYIPLWLDLLLYKQSDLLLFCRDLHSTMVRFIMIYLIDVANNGKAFTFHYGQIYYYNKRIIVFIFKAIYIPLWLDLLFIEQYNKLHVKVLFPFHYGSLYYIN